MADDQKNDGISVRTMTIGVMLVIAYICWGMAASDYLNLEPPSPDDGIVIGRGRRFGLIAIVYVIGTFIANSLHVHEAPGIISNVLRNERWILWAFVVLEVLAVGFGIWVKSMDTKLNQPKRRRKRPLTGPKVEKPKRRKREGI